MTAGMNFLKLFNTDLGVDGRGVEFSMTQQLLNKADVGSVFQHVGGAAMPQDMATAPAFHPGIFQPGRHHTGHHIRIERPTVAGQK